MRIVNTVIYIAIMLSIFGCASSQSEPSADGSRFPKIMPENVVMSYRAFGGYRPITYEIRISDNSISVDKRGGEEAPEKWTEKISDGEKTAIYEAFLKNDFYLIENEKAKGYSNDTIVETVEITFAEIIKKVEYEEREKPLSKQNLERFQNVVTAIKALAEKHNSNSK